MIVLDAGRIVLAGAPKSVFGADGLPVLRRLGLSAPTVVEIAAGLNDRLGTEFAFLTPEHAESSLLAALRAPSCP